MPPKPKPTDTGAGRRGDKSELEEYAEARGPESVATLKALRVGALKGMAFKPFFDQQRKLLDELAEKPSREFWMEITSNASAGLITHLESEGGEGYLTAEDIAHLLAFATQTFAAMYDEIVLGHTAPVVAEPVMGLAELQAEIPGILHQILFSREENGKPLSGPLSSAEIGIRTSVCKSMGCTADEATLVELLRMGAADNPRFR